MADNSLAPPNMPWLWQPNSPVGQPNGLGPPMLNYAAPPNPAAPTVGQGVAQTAADVAQAMPSWPSVEEQRRMLQPLPGWQGTAVDAAKQWAEGVMMGTTAPGDVPPPGIVAYHGSPHSFDQFDASKIGTGEGAQVYGHGLYFAGAEQTAKTYRDALSSPLVSPTGEMVRPPAYSVDDIAKQLLMESKGNWDAAIGRANADVAASRKIGDGEWLSKFGGMPDRLREMQEQGYTYDTTPGHMYEVNIGAEPEHFLDWDKPLSEQHPVVQQTLHSIGALPKPTVESAAGHFGYSLDEFNALPPDRQQALIQQTPPSAATYRSNPTGGEIYQSSKLVPGDYRDPVAAAQALQAAGIPGIRYLDQGSRGAGQGTHNYVVFDAATIDILRKYGIAGLIAGGGAAAAGTQQQQPSQ